MCFAFPTISTSLQQYTQAKGPVAQGALGERELCSSYACLLRMADVAVRLQLEWREPWENDKG